MIKASYDQEHNTVIIEFEGRVDASQGEPFYAELQKIVPKDGKGFKVLTDFTSAEVMNPDIKETVKKTMDFLNLQGVREIVRVIPNPEQDIGFGIMSVFHYSKEVNIITLESREEAWERGRKSRTKE